MFGIRTFTLSPRYIGITLEWHEIYQLFIVHIVGMCFAGEPGTLQLCATKSVDLLQENSGEQPDSRTSLR